MTTKTNVRYLTTPEIEECKILDYTQSPDFPKTVDADALQRKFAKVNNLKLLDSDEYAALSNIDESPL